MHEVWIGRQPIFDRKLATHAYELLFRSPSSVGTDVVPGASATAQVILGALADIGLQRVVGSARAFVNLTRGYVIGQYPLLLPPDRVVLEILEDVEVDRDVLLGVERLKQQGFAIALDDYTGMRPDLDPLLRRADVVKIDCLGRSPDEVRAMIDELAPYKLALLAEKIETHEELELYRSLGFHYFQGYFLERPSLIKSSAIAPQRANLLHLLGELQATDVTIESLDAIVRRDVGLSYKLLACVNSSAFGLARRLETVREALIYLGAANIRNLACLLLLARIDDKPQELVVRAMGRARMCELLAAQRGGADPRAAFTVGMFSLLDALLDQPMQAILEGLPLSTNVQSALTGGKGDLGGLLGAVIACERGDWPTVENAVGTDAALQEIFLASNSWTSALMGGVAPVAAS